MLNIVYTCFAVCWLPCVLLAQNIQIDKKAPADKNSKMVEIADAPDSVKSHLKFVEAISSLAGDQELKQLNSHILDWIGDQNDQSFKVELVYKKDALSHLKVFIEGVSAPMQVNYSSQGFISQYMGPIAFDRNTFAIIEFHSDARPRSYVEAVSVDEIVHQYIFSYE